MIVKSDDLSNYENPLHFLVTRNNIAQTSSYVIDKNNTIDIKWDEDLKRHQDFDYFCQVAFSPKGWCYKENPTSNIDWNEGGTKKIDRASQIVFIEKWRDKFDDKSLKKYFLLNGTSIEKKIGITIFIEKNISI